MQVLFSQQPWTTYLYEKDKTKKYAPLNIKSKWVLLCSCRNIITFIITLIIVVDIIILIMVHNIYIPHMSILRYDLLWETLYTSYSYTKGRRCECSKCGTKILSYHMSMHYTIAIAVSHTKQDRLKISLYCCCTDRLEVQMMFEEFICLYLQSI